MKEVVKWIVGPIQLFAVFALMAVMIYGLGTIACVLLEENCTAPDRMMGGILTIMVPFGAFAFVVLGRIALGLAIGES
jgi:hypothetical protein